MKNKVTQAVGSISAFISQKIVFERWLLQKLEQNIDFTIFGEDLLHHNEVISLNKYQALSFFLKQEYFKT